MKLQRLAEEIERILDINADGMQEHLCEWITWDDQYGEDKDEDDESEPVPEGMYQTVILEVPDDPEVTKDQITFVISGAVTFTRQPQEEEK